MEIYSKYCFWKYSFPLNIFEMNPCCMNQVIPSHGNVVFIARMEQSLLIHSLTDGHLAITNKTTINTCA